MRAFCCPTCGRLVPFEAVSCLSCGTALGFAPDAGEIVAADGRARCANQFLAGCNWLLAPGEADGGLCLCCRLTRTRPDASSSIEGRVSTLMPRCVNSANSSWTRLAEAEGEAALAVDLDGGKHPEVRLLHK